MEFRKTADGFVELPRHNVDFGGGLERIAAASIDSPDVYRIDLLWPIVRGAAVAVGQVLRRTRPIAMRVVTDHMRGAALLAADGVRPGNKAQSYVMRRLVRRALRYALELELTGGIAQTLVPVDRRALPRRLPGGRRRSATASSDVLAKEERSFARTLRKGLAAMRRLGRSGSAGRRRGVVRAPRHLRDARRAVRRGGAAHGDPLSPTWQAEYDALMAEQRARSHQARAAVDPTTV